MTWTNAFDLGACTVTVRDWTSPAAGTVVWSGVLAKGQSQSGTTLAGRAYTLAVDSAGTVSLSFDTDTTQGDSYETVVTPSYAHNWPARISGIASGANGPNVSAAIGEINASKPGAEGVDYLAWTVGGTGPVQFSPDPLDMSSLTGARDLIGVYLETHGL